MATKTSTTLTPTDHRAATPARHRKAITARKNTFAAPPDPRSTWTCPRCGRAGAEILAAQRLDAIRVALRAIVGGNEVSRRELRPHLRTFAERLRAPFLALLECVDEDIVASDLCLPTTRCTVGKNADCTAPDSVRAIKSTRAVASIEALTVVLDAVEDVLDFEGFSCGPFEVAKELHLPGLAVEVLLARVAGGHLGWADIDAFNAWCLDVPAAVRLLENA